QDVGLFLGRGATTDDFHPNVAILIKVELDFRIGLELDDASVSQIQRRAHLVGRLNRRTGQNSCASSGRVAVNGNRLVVPSRESRGQCLLRNSAGRRAGKRGSDIDLTKCKREKYSESFERLFLSRLHEQLTPGL